MGARRFLWAVAAIALLPNQRAWPQDEPKATFNPVASTADDIARVADLVNAERQRNRLAPLKVVERLCISARWHAMDMAVGGYFDHKDRLGRTVGQRLQSFGYRYTYCGQNIAAGQKSAEDAVQAWMNSPSHRENILRPEFKEMGVAVVTNANSKYGRYWVQDFGAP